MKILWILILSILIAPNLSMSEEARAPLSTEILNVVRKSDITIFGEEHSLRDARVILMDFLRRGFDDGTIDGFVTEYVNADMDAEFKHYLTSPSATVGSIEESQFFEKIAQKYVWKIKDETNRNFYRFLRQSQLNHPNLKICGLDAESSRAPSIRAKTISNWPEKLREFAESHFRVSVEEMVRQTRDNFDREPEMALRTWNCLKGTRHAVAHMGEDHAWSMRYDPTKYETPSEKLGSSWIALSQFLKELMPKANIVTIVTAIPERKPGQPYDQVQSIFARASNEYLKSNPPRNYLLSVGSMPENIKQILIVDLPNKSIPMTEVWDYFIIGPEGEYAPVFSDP